MMPRERGKKNGSDLLVASFNNKNKGDIKNLEASKALLLVSIQGNKYCSGDYLQAEIETGITEHQTFTVLIADEIYWHNIRSEADCYLEKLLDEITEQSGQVDELLNEFIPKYFDSLLDTLELDIDFKNNFLQLNTKEQVAVLKDLMVRTEKKLRLEARSMGDRFFEENLPRILSALKLDEKKLSPDFSTLSVDDKIFYINHLVEHGTLSNFAMRGEGKPCNFSIVRWEQWHSQTSFIQNKSKIEHIMQTVPPIKESIQQAALEFAERHSKKDQISKNIWQLRSQYYFRDEAPAIMWLAAHNGYDFIAYPGQILKPFENVQEVFIGSKNKYEIPEALFINCEGRAPYWLDIYFYWKKRPAEVSTQVASPDFINSPPKSPLNIHGIFSQAMENNQEIFTGQLSPEEVSKKINELLIHCPSKFKLEVVEHLLKSVQESSLKSSTAGMSGFP